MKGVYHYKVDTKKFSAKAFGDMADGMPDCSGADMYELNKAMAAKWVELVVGKAAERVGSGR